MGTRCRSLLATGASAAFVFGIAGSADGCARSINCGEIAACQTGGDDVADGYGLGDESDVRGIADAVGLSDAVGADRGAATDVANALGADVSLDATGAVVADAPRADVSLDSADAAAARDAADGGNAPDAPGTDGDAQASDGSGDGARSGPPTIGLGASSPTTKRGGSGGTAQVDPCPGSQIVIGFMGTYGSTAYVDSVQVVCGAVLVTGSGTYRIVVSPGATLPGQGTPGSSAFGSVCPSDEVVVGIHGHSGLYLDQVGIECAPLAISQNGTYAISTGTITQLPASGGPGGTAFGDTCPNGQVAVGSDIASGFFVDSIDLRCATPMFVWPDM